MDPDDPVEAEKKINEMQDALLPLLVSTQEADWDEAVDDTEDHVAASVSC